MGTSSCPCTPVMAMDHTYSLDAEAPPSQYTMHSEDHDHLVPEQAPSATYHHVQQQQTPTATFVYGKPKRDPCAICCQLALCICGCLCLLLGAYVLGIMGLTLIGLPSSPLFAPYDLDDTMNNWESNAHTLNINEYGTPYSFPGRLASGSSVHLEGYTDNVTTSDYSTLRMCFEPTSSSSIVGYGQVVVPVEVFQADATTPIPVCGSGGVSEAPGVSICTNVTLFVSINTTSEAESGMQSFNLQFELDICDSMTEECTCAYLLAAPVAIALFVLALIGPALFLCFFCCCGSICGATYCGIGACCCACSGITGLLSKPSPSRAEYQTLL